MILWNTRYLQLTADDLGIGPDTMCHVAPLGWEHLSLTGDYAWTEDDQPAPGSGERMVENVRSRDCHLER